MFSHVHLREWQLYVKRRGKHAETPTTENSLLPITTITNLTQFFSYFCQMKIPSEYEVDSKVMVFLAGCRPKWEDWASSGCLILQFKEGKEGGESEVLD